jgi:hypothetical protein
MKIKMQFWWCLFQEFELLETKQAHVQSIKDSEQFHMKTVGELAKSNCDVVEQEKLQFGQKLKHLWKEFESQEMCEKCEINAKLAKMKSLHQKELSSQKKIITEENQKRIEEFSRKLKEKQRNVSFLLLSKTTCRIISSNKSCINTATPKLTGKPKR